MFVTLRPSKVKPALTLELPTCMLTEEHGGHPSLTFGLLIGTHGMMMPGGHMVYHPWKAACKYEKKNNIMRLGGPGNRTQVPLIAR